MIEDYQEEMPEHPRYNPVGTDEHAASIAFDVNCNKVEDPDNRATG